MVKFFTVIYGNKSFNHCLYQIKIDQFIIFELRSSYLRFHQFKIYQLSSFYLGFHQFKIHQLRLILLGIYLNIL